MIRKYLIQKNKTEDLRPFGQAPDSYLSAPK